MDTDPSTEEVSLISAARLPLQMRQGDLCSCRKYASHATLIVSNQFALEDILESYLVE